MISSTHNPKVQWIRSLQARARQRRQEQAFVVEGVRLAEEALTSGWETRLVLYSDELDERGRQVLEGFAARAVPVEQATPAVLRVASDTETPQGILAVLSIAKLPLPEGLDLAFIPDGVRDPGNLGTMLRTAAAAGVGAVFLPPGTADPFAPKVVRAAMGAHFKLPILPVSWNQIQACLRRASLRMVLAAAGAGLPYTLADLRSPLALVVGSEAAGASPEAKRLADACVHIPMPGGVESLNAAVAAGILLFEAIRQRTQ